MVGKCRTLLCQLVFFFLFSEIEDVFVQLQNKKVAICAMLAPPRERTELLTIRNSVARRSSICRSISDTVKEPNFQRILSKGATGQVTCTKLLLREQT